MRENGTRSARLSKVSRKSSGILNRPGADRYDQAENAFAMSKSQKFRLPGRSFGGKIWTQHFLCQLLTSRRQPAYDYEIALLGEREQQAPDTASDAAVLHGGLSNRPQSKVFLVMNT